MLRKTTAALLLAATAFATPAFAQDAETSGVSAYVGASGGYHDLGDNDFGDDGGFIGGVLAGVDVPLGDGGVVLGFEGNFHLGEGAIDREYGGAARLGYRFPSGGVAYVRGGYQEVDFDISNLVGVPIGGVDDTDGDYLVGVGGEFPLGSGPVKLRVGVDTVAFDSIRPTAGLIFGF